MEYAMMSIGKRFLVAVFTLALFAASQPALAETKAKTDAAVATPATPATPAPAVPAAVVPAPALAPAPAVAPAQKTDAKADIKTDPKVETKPDTAKPEEKKAEPAKTKEMLEAEAKAKAIMEKANRKIDIKNLPKDITNLLPFDGETFAVSVGETKPIAAARSTKCLFKEAPQWENTKRRLPPSSLVTFADGGAYERMSDRCGGPVPARAVFATGVKSGSERMVIFGQTITVIVK